MKSEQLEKIWTKNFISISLTQLLVFTVFYALLTTLPIYVTGHLGESKSTAGLVVTFMLISAIVARLFSGKILDIVGKRKTLIVSMIMFTVTTVFYLWINQIDPLLVLRFIHGISFGILTTATSSIVADTIPPARRGAGMGYFAMAMNLAIVIGPFIGLTLIQFVSFQTLFIVLNALMLIGLYFSISVKTNEPSTTKVLEKGRFNMKLTDLLEAKAIPVALIGGLVGFAYASILSFLSVHADELGLSATASYFFLVFAIVMIIFRPYLGRAYDEKGAKKVLIPSLFIFSLGLMVLGFTTTSLMLLISAGLMGLGYGTLLPGFQTLSIESTNPNRSGYALSTFFVFYDSGIAAGSYIWGLLIAGVGFGKMYFICALLVLGIIFIFNAYLLKREKVNIDLLKVSETMESPNID